MNYLELARTLGITERILNLPRGEAHQEIITLVQRHAKQAHDFTRPGVPYEGAILWTLAHSTSCTQALRDEG